jgi:magnesium-transporting ATPase (P-type)
MKNLEKLGEKGLRTLLIAERNISDSEYAFFKEENKKASLNLDGRKEKIDETYEILEKDLVLLGATAIEDCLQDDLKQTLKTFRHSGIKLWMLTGDNALTAVSIAHSCGLITKRYLTSMITETHDIEAQVEKIKDRIFGKALKKELLESEKLKHCFVMTGDVLGLLLNDNSFRELRNDMIRQKLQEKGKKINDPSIIIEPENEANLLFLKKVEFT